MIEIEPKAKDTITHMIKTYNKMAQIMNDNNLTILDAIEAIPILIAHTYLKENEEQFSHNLYILTEYIRIFRELELSGGLAMYQPNDKTISE